MCVPSRRNRRGKPQIMSLSRSNTAMNRIAFCKGVRVKNLPALLYLYRYYIAKRTKMLWMVENNRGNG